jgi:hypothetical protein
LLTNSWSPTRATPIAPSPSDRAKPLGRALRVGNEEGLQLAGPRHEERHRRVGLAPTGRLVENDAMVSGFVSR